MRAVSFDRYRQGGDGGGGPERYCRKLEKLSSTPARPVLSFLADWREYQKCQDHPD